MCYAQLVKSPHTILDFDHYFTPFLMLSQNWLEGNLEKRSFGDCSDREKAFFAVIKNHSHGTSFLFACAAKKTNLYSKAYLLFLFKLSVVIMSSKTTLITRTCLHTNLCHTKMQNWKDASWKITRSMRKLPKYYLSCLKLTFVCRRGQSPAEADLNLLETARRCELYGVKMHPAKVC